MRFRTACIGWCLRTRGRFLPSLPFIEAASAKGITAELVEIETFDSTLSRLWRQLASPDPQLDAKVRKAAKQDVVIPLPAVGSRNPILRTNALPIVGLPTKCLGVKFGKPKEWDDLRLAATDAGDAMAFTKEDGVFAWGP